LFESTRLNCVIYCFWRGCCEVFWWRGMLTTCVVVCFY